MAELLRVVIADDQPPFLRAVRGLLGRAPDISIVGEAVDGLAAVALVETLQPDVVVLDVRMPGMDGPSAARTIRKRWPDVSILLCSTHGPDGLEPELAGWFVRKEDLTAAVVRACAAGGLCAPAAD